MSERLFQAIAAYHDGTLDAAGSRLLVAALQGKDGALVRSHLAIDGLLAQAFTADDAVLRSVVERLEAEGAGAGTDPADEMVRAVHRALPTRRVARTRPTGVPWLAAAAAGVLLLIGAALWWGRPSPPACRLLAGEGVLVERAGGSIGVAAGAALQVRDRLVAGVSATLAWADGSRLELPAGGALVLARPGSAATVVLERGRLLARIMAQPPGAPFVIVTPEARIEVVGTRFAVESAARRTQVELYEGGVRLTRVADGRALTLRPDQGATVAADVELVARALAAPVPAAAASAPVVATEPAWSPLFPASGLEGWVAQHGAWTRDGALVRGTDARAGKARLLSARSYGDLELTCRLRIGGVEFAEVQVGDYNWFVEVPARADAWVELRLRQRGQDLEASADGVALKPLPGAGRPARAGPLGFYVRPGGSLEIADARVREPR